MKRDWFGTGLRLAHEFLEEQWFDRTRKVRTSGNVALQRAGVGMDEQEDSELYQPARPAHIRRALREVPAHDLSSFSFIDLGSGKGRTLLIAAEFRFEQILGVEFSPALHEQACRNIARFRPWRLGCGKIASIHANAKDFVFPDGKIVLYMFNPFGASTMRRVLDHLRGSLERTPRQVVVILLWPRCQDQVAAIEGMQLRRETRQYQIYEFAAERLVPESTERAI